MRRKLIAGNWKMNMLVESGIDLTVSVVNYCKNLPENAPEVLICPPMSLLGFIGAIKLNNVMLGAQDVAETTKETGAFTGDVSAKMVADLKASYTIVGHSERRTLHNETDVVVQRKALNAYTANLTAIICVGETEQEREAGMEKEIVSRQIKGSVPLTATAENTVIAYEPVWAIGTGNVPTVADITAMHAHIRAELIKLLGQDVADKVRVLYGGSVKASNAKEILAIDNVDGALIGGASLKKEEFCAIIQSQI